VNVFVVWLSVPLGDQKGRLDLSHPVHVDNCLLEPDTKQCWREPPAFIHRDLRYTQINKMDIKHFMIKSQKDVYNLCFNSVVNVIKFTT